MKADILEIISDYDNFVAEHWSEFVYSMIEKGFTEDDVEKMGEDLLEFLKENKMR